MKSPMDIGSFIWCNGKILNSYKSISVPLLAQSINYGFGAFEAMRTKEIDGGTLIFRLKDHIERLFYSANKLLYPLEDKFTREEIQQATQCVIYKNKIPQVYIRISLYFGDIFPGFKISKDNMHIAVLAFPMAYPFCNEIRVTIAEKRKDSRNTMVDIKGSGQYQIFTYERERAKQKGFDDALFLDNNNNIAEGVGSNIFLVKDKILYTPPLENILPGVTRNSVLKFASDLGYDVIEEHIPYSQLMEFSEAFFVGTAMGVLPIKQINDYQFSSMNVGLEFQRYYHNITEGKIDKYSSWLTKVVF